MSCNRGLRFPLPAVLPGVQAMRDKYWPARELSWALKGISQFHLADASRLRACSDTLIARSHQLRIPLA